MSLGPEGGGEDVGTTEAEGAAGDACGTFGAVGVLDGEVVGATGAAGAVGDTTGPLGAAAVLKGGAHGCIGAPPPAPIVPPDAMTIFQRDASQLVMMESCEKMRRTSTAHAFQFELKARPYAV